MVVEWLIGSLLVLLLSSALGNLCMDAKDHHQLSIAFGSESDDMATGMTTQKQAPPVSKRRHLFHKNTSEILKLSRPLLRSLLPCHGGDGSCEYITPESNMAKRPS